MNLRKISGTIKLPKDIHITEVKFKYIKYIKTKKHLSCYDYSQTHTGIFGIKNKKIYKLISYTHNTCWHYALLPIHIGPFYGGHYYDRTGRKAEDIILVNIFNTKSGHNGSISDYMLNSISNNHIDYFFSLRDNKGLIELFEAVHVKKYKTGKLKDESKKSTKKES